MKLADVRFYVDADILGLAKVLEQLRADVTFPGDPGRVVHKRSRPACPVTSPRALDDAWIPVVAERGWLAITRDSKIAQHSAEVTMVREHGARLVAISGQEGLGTWEQLEIVMSQWRQLEKLQELPGPFIYRMTRTSLAALDMTA